MKLIYVIDSSIVKRGDILLTRSDDQESVRIRKFSNSDYSHCLLYVGDHSVIESSGLGVQANNTQRLPYYNETDVLALRFKSDLFDQIIDEIEYSAREKIGVEYSSKEARLARSENDQEAKEQNRQFCTRFVAQAYQDAGINVVRNPNYCTPGDLQKSNNLIEIKKVLRKASEPEIELALEKDTPLTRQIDTQNSILESVRNYTKEDIQSFNQLAQYLLNNPLDTHLESTIINIFQDSGYLTMWKNDIIKNPWNYDIKKFRAYYHPDDQYQVGHKQMLRELEIRKRLIETRKASEHCYSFWKQEYFRMLIELYDTLIQLSEQREKTGRLASQ